MRSRKVGLAGTGPGPGLRFPAGEQTAPARRSPKGDPREGREEQIHIGTKTRRRSPIGRPSAARLGTRPLRNSPYLKTETETARFQEVFTAFSLAR